jgi:Fe-S cluster assembly protein SufD
MSVDFLNIDLKTLSNGNAFREGGLTRALSLGVPTSKNEEWRFISLKGLQKQQFSINNESVLEDVDLSTFGEADGYKLVFIDGVFQPKLSDSIKSKGVSFQQLEIPSLTADAFDGDFFAALNASSYTSSVEIQVQANTSVEKPILLYFLQGSKKLSSYAAPRVSVKVGAFSKATIVEHFATNVAGSVYYNNPFTAIEVGESAKLTHYRVQRESKAAFHIARVQAHVGKQANYSSYTFNFGAKLCRNDIRAIQTGLESHFTIDGLVMLQDDQVSDTHSVMDHAFPYGTSHQLHKVLADDKSHSVFNGKIFVRQDAQKIDSFQENRNILLSNNAKINTKPQLEIFADDVKCSHGATIGQMETEELFYLKSRGLSEVQSKLLITRGFALEVIEEVEIAELVALLSDEVENFVVKVKV